MAAKHSRGSVGPNSDQKFTDRKLTDLVTFSKSTDKILHRASGRDVRPEGINWDFSKSKRKNWAEPDCSFDSLGQKMPNNFGNFKQILELF